MNKADLRFQHDVTLLIATRFDGFSGMQDDLLGNDLPLVSNDPMLPSIFNEEPDSLFDELERILYPDGDSRENDLVSESGIHIYKI